MLNVFYRKEQTANVNVFSPSPRKPKLVVDAWIKEFGDQIEIKSFDPVTREQLYAVHDKTYVDGVLSCTLPNGFGTYHKEVANSLLYTSGSLLAAAKNALETGIAVSPTSGFHHSEYGGMYRGVYGGAGAQGYCTFNGCALVAVDLLNSGKVKKVGVIDLDMHMGNGLKRLIPLFGLTSKIKHFTAGEFYHTEDQAGEFLARLPYIIKSMQDCDLLIVQLGADPHIEDPLGGWLTTANMRKRDRIVFETCKGNAINLVVNLAGGYQTPVEKVVQLHVNMLQECLNVYGDAYAC